MLVALASLLAAFAVVLSGHGSLLLLRIERGYDDLRTVLFSDRLTGDHLEIVLVSVGDNVSDTRATFETGRKGIDVDRGQLARLIDAIDDSAPRAIGFDVPIAGASDPAKDQQLQQALREAKARVVMGIRTGSVEVNAERRVWLERFLAGTGRASGHITTIYDDAQARAVRVDSEALAMGSVPNAFALLMARALRPEVRRSFGGIAWLQKIDEGGWLSRFVNVGAQQPFRVLYASDFIENTKTPPRRQLSGRLVLVTTGLAELDRHRTPLSIWSGDTLAPIQIQAQAIAQLLDGRQVTELMPDRPVTLRLALFMLACLAGLVGWFRGPGWHIPGTLVAIAALLFLDVMAFSWRGLAFPLIPALIVWLMGEIAGRNLRRILNWEEQHGHPWPLEESDERVERVERAYRAG